MHNEIIERDEQRHNIETELRQLKSRRKTIQTNGPIESIHLGSYRAMETVGGAARYASPGKPFTAMGYWLTMFIAFTIFMATWNVVAGFLIGTADHRKPPADAPMSYQVGHAVGGFTSVVYAKSAKVAGDSVNVQSVRYQQDEQADGAILQTKNKKNSTVVPIIYYH